MSSPIKDALYKAKNQFYFAWSEAHAREPHGPLATAINKLLEDTDEALKLTHTEEEAQAEAKRKDEEASWRNELDHMIRASRDPHSIAAIKFYRAKTGCDLRESQNFVAKRKQELKGN